MKFKFWIILFITTVAIGISIRVVVSSKNDVLANAENQYSKTVTQIGSSSNIPRSLNDYGSLKSVGIYNWTSGFFAGSLWYLYELTGENKWRNEAIRWTEILDTIQYFTGNHNIGFMINCSYGNALRLTQDSLYKDVIINAAESLISRFNAKVGCLKSWDYRKAWDGKTEWYFPVTIDNMMNLELLFLASHLSNDSKFKEIAITHAQTTMQNHYRNNYSCYQVVDYDSKTGRVLDKANYQGFSDESSWARGQAWGLYEYVMCYRETGKKEFLHFARGIAKYIMDSPFIPSDKIPYWDYNVGMNGFEPKWEYHTKEFPFIPRDVSAAAITASALFELAHLVENGSNYYNYASEIIKTLTKSSYSANSDENNYFYLKKSVGSIPHRSEINKPVNYADYYFFEALIRKRNIENETHY